MGRTLRWSSVRSSVCCLKTRPASRPAKRPPARTPGHCAGRGLDRIPQTWKLPLRAIVLVAMVMVPHAAPAPGDVERRYADRKRGLMAAVTTWRGSPALIVRPYHTVDAAPTTRTMWQPSGGIRAGGKEVRLACSVLSPAAVVATEGSRRAIREGRKVYDRQRPRTAAESAAAGWTNETRTPGRR